MSKYKYLLLAIILLTLTTSCKLFDNESKNNEILGCTDENAQNYDPEATKDDGSCDFCTGDPSSSFLLISKDGGITWEKKCFNIPVSNIIDISVIDSNNIWVCTAPMFNNGHTEAQILHSNNGGYTWEEQFIDTEGTKFFNYIEFFDEFNGIAMGDGNDDIPIFLKTTDSGKNWIKTTTDAIGGWSGDAWRRLDFVNINTGFFKGAVPFSWGNLYKTTDSGNTWSIVNFPDSTNVWVLKFFNENIGLISVGNDELLRTTDGGITWETQDIDWGGGWALDIEFHPTNPDIVWMGRTSSYLYSSIDGGATWNREQTALPQLAKIWDIYAGDNSVWCSGYWIGKELFVKKEITTDIWEQIQLPLDDNKMLEGVIDGVGDNIVVLPGHYY